MTPGWVPSGLLHAEWVHDHRGRGLLRALPAAFLAGGGGARASRFFAGFDWLLLFLLSAPLQNRKQAQGIVFLFEAPPLLLWSQQETHRGHPWFQWLLFFFEGAPLFFVVKTGNRHKGHRNSFWGVHRKRHMQMETMRKAGKTAILGIHKKEDEPPMSMCFFEIYGRRGTTLWIWEDWYGKRLVRGYAF